MIQSNLVSVLLEKDDVTIAPFLKDLLRSLPTEGKSALQWLCILDHAHADKLCSHMDFLIMQAHYNLVLTDEGATHEAIVKDAHWRKQ